MKNGLLLITDEIKQEREFYRLRGLPCPKDVPIAGSDLEEKSIMDAHAESDYHRHEEQVHLEMVIGENMKSLPRKFIRCSSQATITHIKKYIAKKVWSPEKYSNVSQIKTIYYTKLMLL